MTKQQAIQERSQAEFQYQLNRTRLNDLRQQTRFNCTPAQRKVRNELEQTVSEMYRKLESWDYTLAEMQWYGEGA